MNETSDTVKTLSTELSAAMKSKDSFATKVLRLLKSQLDSAEKDKREPLSDDEVVKILKKKIKQGEEAKEKYLQGNRPELAEVEQKEIDFLQKYLPAQMSQEQVAKIVDEALAELGEALTIKDFGRAMGAVMKKVGSSVDGVLVKELVQKKLK